MDTAMKAVCPYAALVEAGPCGVYLQPQSDAGFATAQHQADACTALLITDQALWTLQSSGMG